MQRKGQAAAKGAAAPEPPAPSKTPPSFGA